MQRVEHYQVIGELGRGGMGVVFKAWDPLTQTHVAIKLLLAAHNRKRLSRFKREVQVLQRLQHPNVIPIRAYGEVDGRPYLVMSLVEGKSLDELVESRGPLPASMVAELGIKLASALHAAHELGILHRDVKPDNVLLRADGDAFLGDFGLAKDEALDTTQLTVEGGFMGTPGYVAPEQAMGEANLVGPATDVYGLGATLYYALTGRAPVEGGTILEVVSNLHKPPAKIRSLRADVPRELASLVERCLRPELRDRYRSCAVVLRDLEDFLRGSSRFEVPSARGPARPWPLLVSLVVVLLLLLVAVATLRQRAAPTVAVEDPVEDPVVVESLADVLEAARLAASRKDWDAARAEYERALTLDADDPDALHGLWQAMNQLEDPRQFEVLRRAIARDPRPQACQQLAVIYALQERTEDALEVLALGVSAHPELASLRRSYGRTLAKIQRWSDALPQLQQAWDLESGSEDAVHLARCLAQLRRVDDALAVLGVARARDPEQLDLAYVQGQLLFGAKRYAEAVAPLTLVWRGTEAADPRISETLANALTELEQTDDALAVLESALARAPQDTSLLFARSTAHSVAGHATEELNDLDSVLALDPNNRAALNNRSLALFQLGRYEASLADARKLISVEPESVSGWTQVAACHYKLQDFAAARDAYTKVSQIEPESLAPRVGRAQCYHRLEDYDAAIADYTWILARDPDQHAMRFNRGLAYASTGRPELARETMHELLRRTQPGSHHAIRATDWLEQDARTRAEPPK
ncbi:MAG: protein kinase [Planctomycetota bacterium]